MNFVSMPNLESLCEKVEEAFSKADAEYKPSRDEIRSMLRAFEKHSNELAVFCLEQSRNVKDGGAAAILADAIMQLAALEFHAGILLSKLAGIDLKPPAVTVARAIAAAALHGVSEEGFTKSKDAT